MKDWMIRALKTFVQAFFGVLIPAVCTMLSNGWPESWAKIWVLLAPTVAAALAAAISAVWNIILEAMEISKLAGQNIAGREVSSAQAEEVRTVHPSAEEIIGEQVDKYTGKH